MKEKLVSIVLPTFNSSKHIRESIDSVIAQTYKNWELIIIDGHSCDGTIEIINDYIKSDKRISLYYDEGGGLGAALKLACTFVKGNYIARLDADDIALPDRIQKEMEYLEKHPNVAVVSCSADFISEDGVSIGYFFPFTWSFQVLMQKRNSIIHSGVLMRKEIYEKSGGYSAVKSSEDFLLWCRMRRYGAVHIIEYPYVKYRFSDGALTGNIPENIGSIFLPYLDKKILSDLDVACINEEICKRKKINENLSSRYVSPYENNLFHFLNKVFDSYFAFKIVFFFKNIYGVFKYHSTNM